MLADRFADAVVGSDADALKRALADDVVFRSPVLYRPYEGKEIVGRIITEAAMKVFSDFRYVDRFEGGGAAALVFEARVGDREVQGLDLLRFHEDGRVRELTVMVRPMSGLLAVAEAMGREFERLGIAPTSG